MKKKLLIIFCLFICCVCFADKNISAEIEISEEVSFTIGPIRDSINSVTFNKKVYGPKDAKKNTMTEVVFNVKNNGSQTIKTLDFLKSIELASADKEGNLSFNTWEILFEENYKTGGTQEEFDKNFYHIEEYNIESGTIFSKKVYFVHPKGESAVAFTNNREPVYEVMKSNVKNAESIKKNLLKASKFPICCEMVKTVKVLELEDFMIQYGITVNDEDKNGMTLLYYAIKYKNNDVLDYLISNKADINHLVRFMGVLKITPLQFAVLNENNYAADKILESGADLFFKDSSNGISDIGILAIQLNSLNGAKYLYNHGYNFSTIKIGGGWSPVQTAVEYADSHKYSELSDFLKSISE